MSSMWDKVSSYMLTGTSILGTAVATPAFAGALSGAITWREAALPIGGGIIAILMNEKTAAPASPVVVLKAVDSMANTIGADMAQNPNAVMRDVGAIIPVITDELEHAFANFQAAQARLAAAKDGARAQADALSLSLAKAGTNAPAPAPQEAQQAAIGSQQYTPAHV